MINSFKYKCNCDSKPRITLNAIRDANESAKLDKALDQLVDSAWGDEDEEADELLAAFIQNMKRTAGCPTPADQLEKVMDGTSGRQAKIDNVILSGDLLAYPDETCHCREVSQRLSLVLSWGWAELCCSEQPNEQRLLEVLEQTEPFAGDVFGSDKTWNGFMCRLWNYCTDRGIRSLISKMVPLYPNEIDRIVGKLLSSELEDMESLEDSSDFNSLACIISVPEVFRHVSLYLAEKDATMANKTQPLLAAILKRVRSNLTKSKYLALYSQTLSPIVAMLNEIINPDDPLVISLLENVKHDCYLDYVILITHFPAFHSST